MGASVLIGALELGLLYAIMGFGVYLSFRVLNIPDLTIDGSFTCDARQRRCARWPLILISDWLPPFSAACAAGSSPDW